MPSALVDSHDGVTGRPTGPDNIDDLCLGMELKFLMLGLPRSEGSSKSHERHPGTPSGGSDVYQKEAYSALARAIDRRVDLDRPLPAGSYTPIQPRAVSKADIVDAGLDERDYWPSHWIVKKANSVEHMPEDPRPDVRHTNGVAVPVELNSPKLAWKDAYAPFLVNKVLSRVKSFPTYVNYTCDVHVHIGRCDGTAFTLPTLKKLATLFWLVEPVVRSVRNPYSPNFTNAYTWGFEQRRYSRLALALDKRTPKTDNVTIGEDMLMRIRNGSGMREDDKDWYQYMTGAGSAAFRNEALRAIWRCASAQELGLLLSGSQREHRRLGFNFSAFGGEDERSRTNPRTLEFRILEGTLEEHLIQGWLQICGKLVELGMKGRQTQFQDTIRYLLSRQKAYEDLRNNVDLDPVRSHDRSEQTKKPTRDVLFAEFMDRIGVSVAAYRPFQDKIRQEYKPV